MPTCERCGRTFTARPDSANRFCSRACIAPPLAERFWAKVDRTGGAEACWPWLGATSAGYGQIWLEGKHQPATHVALALDGRPLEDGQVAMHRCDNPPCVNPAHLTAGTYSDNALDMDAKGRRPELEQDRVVQAERTAASWARYTPEEREARIRKRWPG